MDHLGFTGARVSCACGPRTGMRARMIYSPAELLKTATGYARE